MVNTKIRLIIFFAAKDGDALYNQKKRLGTDCGSDHELLIAKFRLKWKDLRPFTYDLDRVPYDYIMEVTGIFKGLDLIECLKNYGWRFHDIVHEAVIKEEKQIQEKRNATRQNGYLRGLYK